MKEKIKNVLQVVPVNLNDLNNATESNADNKIILLLKKILGEMDIIDEFSQNKIKYDIRI